MYEMRNCPTYLGGQEFTHTLSSLHPHNIPLPTDAKIWINMQEGTIKSLFFAFTYHGGDQSKHMDVKKITLVLKTILDKEQVRNNS